MSHTEKPLYIGKNLKFLTEQKGYNQTSIAPLVNIVRTTWNGYVKHNKRPSGKNLEKISDFFDTSVDSLLYEDIAEKNIVEEETLHYDTSKAFKTEIKTLKEKIKLLTDHIDTLKILLESKENEIRSLRGELKK